MGILIILSMVSMFSYLLYAGRYYLHMFQLSSYYQGRFYKWQFKNVKVSHIVLAILAAASAFMSCLYKPFPAALVALSLVGILLHKAPAQKKKMVYTARVKRQIAVFAVLYALMCLATLLLFVNAVINHSRTPFCIAYIVLAVCSFLPCVFISLSALFNLPIEKCVQKYYKNDAKKILDKNRNITVVGITGSYGKTSSKYILHTVLSEKFNTLMTPESYNTIMGVVKTVRSSLSPLHQVFIVEMGAKHVGEIKEIAELVKPKYSLITTVGIQHLESFGSEENITKTKFEIVDALGEDGVAFLNYDCEKIKNHNTFKNTVTFGLSDGLDFRAEDIKCSDKGTAFTLCTKDGRKIPLSTKLLGTHNVMNIVSASAIGLTLGISEAELTRAVAKLVPVPHRLELKSGGAYTVIDDAFNSNPVGAAASLDVLSHFDGYKKIIVTPGFIELGEKQAEESFSFGKKIASVCDAVILVGKEVTKDIKAGIESESYGGELFVADTLSQALTFIPAIDGEKKAVLFENDLPDNYEPQKR